MFEPGEIVIVLDHPGMKRGCDWWVLQSPSEMNPLLAAMPIRQ